MRRTLGGTVIRRVARAALLAVAAIIALWLAGIIAYRWIEPPLTPLMLIRLAEGEGLDHRPRPLAALAPSLGDAVIAAEDNRFCLHRGVDWNAVGEALDDLEEKGRLRGASTITMQVARNLFLWPGGGVARKAAEVPLAYAIERLWPKRRILEVYLNIAEWGHGLYGAEAASRAHFRKPAARLSPHEAALLAAVLPNPRRWDAGRPTDYIERRAGAIEARIARLGTLLACKR
jgi:monofunctional biosynthetic peptidoglycan transglycosylase